MKTEYINPGDLDRRIAIVRIARSIGAKGQTIVERQHLTCRHASVEVEAIDEAVEDGNVRSVRWLDIVMYRFSRMQPTDEVEFEGRRYNVTSINEIRLTPFVRVRAREVLGYE